MVRVPVLGPGVSREAVVVADDEALKYWLTEDGVAEMERVLRNLPLLHDVPDDDGSGPMTRQEMRECQFTI